MFFPLLPMNFFGSGCFFLAPDAFLRAPDAIFWLRMHLVKVYIHVDNLCTPWSFALGV
jgi:hypothetical protein